MPQALGRIKETILKNTGDPWVGINFELRRQGATVNGDQSGASPLTVAVHDLGGIVDGDVVAIDEGTAQLSVSAVSIANRTVELSGFVGTLSVDDGSRITPIGSLPVVYLDLALANSGTNPLITDSKGDVLSNASDVAYAPYGSYDYLLSGDDQDGNAITTELVRDFWVSAISPFDDGGSARDNVKVDNITDDGVSLNNALSDLSRTLAGLYGGVKELPNGICLTSVQVIVPPRITLRGTGHRSTQIHATPSFPTSTAVVHMGDPLGSSYQYGMGLCDIGVVCNGISGSIGVESTTANQCTSIRRVVVSRYVARGISLTTDFCNNFTIAEVDLLHETSATSAVGMYIDIGTSVRLSDISFNAHDGATKSTAQAILLAGSCSISASRIYVEQYATGISVGAGCRAFVDTIEGTSDTTTALLHMDSLANGLTAFNIIQGGATNAIKNDRDSHTGSIAHGGFYIATFDGGAGTYTIWSSNTSFTSTMNGPVRFLGAVGVMSSVTGSGSASLAGTFAGSPTLSGSPTFSGTPLVSGTLDISSRIRLNSFENIAIATSISVVKNNVRITGNGPVTLSTIQIDGGAPGAAHDGMEVTILLSLASTNTYTIDQGGNILLEAGATIGLTAGQMATFKWVNAESKWFQTSPKAAH